MQHGFVKVAAVTPKIEVADPWFNVKEAKALILECAKKKAKIIVFPELSLTGATCNDLFLQKLLVDESKKALQWLALETAVTDALIFVGLPWKQKNKLYNVMAVLNQGKVIALIPQSKIKNFSDRDGMRYFAPAGETVEKIQSFGYEIPFGSKLLFSADNLDELVVGCAIGEDFCAISSLEREHALAGATVVVNPYACGETVTAGKDRKNLVKAFSRTLAAGLILSGAGEGESTQDLVCLGHKLIGENGNILAEAYEYEERILIQDLDVFRLAQERVRRNTFEQQEEGYLWQRFHTEKEECVLDRSFSVSPFLPADQEKQKKRLSHILRIQAGGLKKRLTHTGCGRAVIGLSGGLDSTLALLVTVEAFALLGLDRKQIHCVTMPCFGTTDRTYDNACMLARELGTELEEIDIKEAVNLHFRDIGHDKEVRDVTYENSQARERTQILMDIANRENALVIGTGDLSELALGWATYNGDHMSMYGVNAGVPKTLVRHLVEYYATNCGKKVLADILMDILATPVSPELLPPVEGEIAQKTEDLVGPYELHDFFLYYMLRFGYEPEKIYRIASASFQGQYEKKVILKWLKIFCRRFFAQQFKRSCLPDGPKVGSVCLSPRGDFRMPSDAASAIWLEQLERIEVF